MTAIPYILLNALIAVESHGRDNARGRAGELGCLQISAGVLEDVRRITKTFIAPTDCFSRLTSCEIALTYLGYYVTKERLGREPVARDYVMVWHWGPNGWKRRGRDEYWEKVRKLLPPNID